MESAAIYRGLADVVLVIHVGFVGFVVFGLLLVLLGGLLQWGWVRYLPFRVLHLMAIGQVVVQAWLGIICPLTTLEMWLREKAGDFTYQGTFIAHWLQSILFYEAPAWVFTLCYTTFASLVVASWVLVKPKAWQKQGSVASLPDKSVQNS